MRRSRLVAVLAAAVLALATFLVPGTAQADVDEVNLSVSFDRLSAGRVATVTLTAKSESGVTHVEATVQNYRPEEEKWVAIETLPLTRTDGTANDGTWQADYQTDIEAHPGGLEFSVKITSADGATHTSDPKYIDNCYPLAFSGLTSSPDVIDADTPATVEGSVLVQRTRDSEPEPVSDVTVSTSGVSVRTRVDGTFSYTTPYTSNAFRPMAGVEPRLCAVYGLAPEPEITKQEVELTAQLVTPSPIHVGDQVAVEGRLQRLSADGLVPVPEAQVDVYVVTENPRSYAGSVRTSEDGTFRLEFTAEQSGRLTLESRETRLLLAGLGTAGQLEVRPNVPFTDVRFASSTVGFRESFWVSGYLAADPTDPMDPEKIPDAWVSLEYSRDGESWREIRRGKTDGRAYFKIETTETTEGGYWRVRYPGANGETVAVSDAQYVSVRYGTRIDDFGAAATGGGAVTVRGSLVRLEDEPEPVGQTPVYVYFLPAGGSAWELQGSASTGSDGSFEKEFAADRDGEWTAWYWGDDEHVESNSSVVHVDVPVTLTTEISEFGVAPETVAAGGTITVEGLLTRVEGAGEPEAAPDKPVTVYFLPAGQQEWQEMAVTRTGADGRFEETFTAEQDGSWTAWFFGDAAHGASNPGTRFVDVQ